MLRFFVAAFLLLQLLGQVTGAVYAGELACEVAPDDSGDAGDENCAPGCEECFCCRHPRLIPDSFLSESAVLEVRELDFASWDQDVIEPDPSEIMHVPKVGAVS